MASTTTAFEVDDVEVTFPGHSGPNAVLEHLDLRVAAGEVLTIVGGSGTGKSTLLRLLGGLAHPTAGVVAYRGAPVAAAPQGVVMVFQDYTNSLLPWRSVRQNIALGLANRGLSAAERVSELHSLLELVGLSAAADRYPWQLSGGMQQRVQIARAIATDPQALLMDEPFGALDAITRAGLQDELARIQRMNGATTVFITHDVEEAIYLGDRVVVLGGSPARVVAEFAVELPHPREQLTTRELPEYAVMRHAVHAALHPEGA